MEIINYFARTLQECEVPKVTTLNRALCTYDETIQVVVTSIEKCVSC
jgi:hypothetical protein